MNQVNVAMLQAQNEALQKQIEAFKTENEILKKAKNAAVTGIKVTEKGGVSVYGLGRFPVTLYKSQWIALLDKGEAIRQFMVDHASELTTKESKTQDKSAA